MDWNANLATIIKHTDANLEQQFRQFTGMASDMTTFHQSYLPEPPSGPSSGSRGVKMATTDDEQEEPASNFAHVFLRDTLASVSPIGRQGHGLDGGASSTPAAYTTGSRSFADHFHERQERKRREKRASASGGNAAPHRSDSSYGDAVSGDDDEYLRSQPPQVHARVQPARGHRRRSNDRSSNGNNQGMGHYMYSSPTYDMAQMMEQVRLSLKLEVDARAAIAERQLSALLQLCKATSEELDRLRIEVCAADRQLHTLDQVQAKMRQELTTQKDVGYHLQSMCGKDESWRVQADNQLLELRQLVAALREHGNSVQTQVQEKLSRQELLVQFNAAIEPIKAQFQATLQHQAQTLAEVTRASSSSGLTLDALTVKVNRIQSDEIVQLRNEVQALKSHVTRIGGALENPTVLNDNSKRQRDKEDENAMRDEFKRVEDSVNENGKKWKAQIKEELQAMIATTLKTEFDSRLVDHRREIQDSVERDFVTKTEAQAITRQLEKNHIECLNGSTSSTAYVDTQMKQLEQSLRTNVGTVVRELKERQEQQSASLIVQQIAPVEAQMSCLKQRLHDFVKSTEDEHKATKQALDRMKDDHRVSRHAIEEQLHRLSLESRSKVTALVDDAFQKERDTERKWREALEKTGKDGLQQFEATIRVVKSELREKIDDAVVSTKALAEQVTKFDVQLQQLKLVQPTVEKTSEQTPKDRRSNSETLVQFASIDSTLQKMMLHMQLNMQQQQQLQQQQQQQQAQLALHASMQPTFSGYWANSSAPPTPVASSTHVHIPPPPTLPHLQVPVKSESPVIQHPTSIPTDAVRPQSSTTPIGKETPTTSSLNDDKRVGVNNTLTERKALEDHIQLDDIISRVVQEKLPTDLSGRPDPKKQPAAPSDASPPPAKSTPLPEHVPQLPSTSPPSKAQASPSPSPSMHETAASLPPTPPMSKIQQTLATTAKGAMAEAEMAKMRVEARRKQQENSTQQPSSGSQELANGSHLTRSASASYLDETVTSGTPRVEPTTFRARSNSIGGVLDQPMQAPEANTAINSSTSRSPMPAQQSHVQSPTPSQPQLTTATEPRPSPPSQNSYPTEPPMPTPAIPPPMPLTTLTKPIVSPPECPGTGIQSSSPSAQLTPDASSGVSSAMQGQSEPTRQNPSSTPVSATSSARPISHVLCEQCRLPVRTDLVADHMVRQCIKRTVPCDTCQAKIMWHEVENHTRECKKSATDKVADPDAAAGLASSTSKPAVTPVERATDPMKKCRHCSTDILATDLFEHELRCDQMLKQCPHCLRRQKIANLQDHIENCDCRLVSCPNECGGKFLQRGVAKHLSTRCPKRPVGGGPTSITSPSVSPTKDVTTSSATPNATTPVQISVPSPNTASAPPTNSTAATATNSAHSAVQKSPTEMVECKFCDEEFSTGDIDSHENECDWKPKRCQFCNMVIISRDLSRHEMSCKVNAKNCPHCNEVMSQATLTTHTSRCSKRPIKCIRCCQLFPADSIVAHSSSCKFVPSSSTSGSALTRPATAVAPTSLSSTAPVTSTAATPMKIPPPPPYPPTSIAQSARSTTTSPHPSTLHSSGASNLTTPSTAGTILSPGVGEENNVADRLARRSLALSQLTNQPVSNSLTVPTDTSLSRPVVSVANTPSTIPRPARPELDEDYTIDDDDDEEGDDDEDDDEDDDDQLTLAQVVAEWSVENVCLWLHEDVGVPDVVPRFQQRQCNGEMLLELTESDLINDFGIKNRLHRERILSAIDAIKTSDEFSDDEEEEEEEEEDDDVDGGSAHTSASFTHPRDLLRRSSLPVSPASSSLTTPGSSLPSSSAMLRRINSAINVDFPPSSRYANMTILHG